jgi:quercetin dioxygenase-like cupin family protein
VHFPAWLGDRQKTPLKIWVNVGKNHGEAGLNHRLFRAAGAALLALLILAGGAMYTIAVADEVPDAVTASPDVHKVIAENDSVRVVATTLKPGQRDMMHSHPAIGIYILSGCEKMRVHSADGTSHDWGAKSGTAGANVSVTSHSIENIGDTECRQIYFEPK